MDSGASRGTRFKSPPHEHLRKGTNQVAAVEDTDWSAIPVFSKSMTDYLGDTDLWLTQASQPDPSEFETTTRVKLGPERQTLEGGQISHFTEVRLAKRSPVKPSGQTVLR